jgi:hypothetical protein
LQEAKNLIVIGCFCIGTNQVDLDYAAKHGIAVFNSPFSNSRSVAELVVGEIIILARQLGDRSNEMHKGTWNKVSNKCWEIRGKTLGMLLELLYSYTVKQSNIVSRHNWVWSYRVATVCSGRIDGDAGLILRCGKPYGPGNCKTSPHACRLTARCRLCNVPRPRTT